MGWLDFYLRIFAIVCGTWTIFIMHFMHASVPNGCMCAKAHQVNGFVFRCPDWTDIKRNIHCMEKRVYSTCVWEIILTWKLKALAWCGGKDSLLISLCLRDMN